MLDVDRETHPLRPKVCAYSVTDRPEPWRVWFRSRNGGEFSGYGIRLGLLRPGSVVLFACLPLDDVSVRAFTAS